MESKHLPDGECSRMPVVEVCVPMAVYVCALVGSY